ncbi:MAG: hypothetical protein Q8P99_00375 [bacterium]|nr:hypothetical protein [bacterium]
MIGRGVLLKRILIIVSLFVVGIVALVGFFIYSFSVPYWGVEGKLNEEISQINLPDSFELVKSSYFNANCLDQCPTIENEYKVVGMDEYQIGQIVRGELEANGFRFDSEFLGSDFLTVTRKNGISANVSIQNLSQHSPSLTLFIGYEWVPWED